MSAPLVIALVLRLSLVTLPGFGRDEATYVYWSQHFDTWYTPLLQALLAVQAAVVGIHPALLRILPLLWGMAVLVLFDRWLVEREFGSRQRSFALAAVALSPWQSYVGALIHPDGLLLVAMLLFALFAARGRILAAATAATLALAAKPSGALVVAFALVWLTSRWRHDRMRTSLALFVLLVPMSILASQWSLPMLEALRAFAQQPATLGPFARVGLGIGGLAFLAAPPLLWATVASLRSPWQGPAGVRLGRIYVLAFVMAALLSGQVKANWLLPGVVLAWPSIAPGPRHKKAMLGASILLSVSMVVALRSPGTLRRVEENLGPYAPRYLDFAGRREAEVASASRWWQRCSEYQSIRPWATRLAETHPELLRARSIVSDDYGLAARLALAMEKLGPNGLPRLVLPLDPLFDQDVEAAPGPQLVLAVRHSCADLRLECTRSVTWTHPITGDSIQVALVGETFKGEHP